VTTLQCAIGGLAVTAQMISIVSCYRRLPPCATEMDSLCERRWVTAVWYRPKSEFPPHRVPFVHAVAGVGFKDDCHADPLSPRQALIVSELTYRRFDLPRGALRENLTVSFPTESLVSGTLICIGDSVRLRIMFQCEPCAKLNEKQSGLMRKVGRSRGTLARVVRHGTVQPGDDVTIIRDVFPTYPDIWQARVLMIAESIPVGTVMEYRQLARVAGVPLTYCRVFPRLLHSADPTFRERVVAAGENPSVKRWNGDTFYSTSEERDLESRYAIRSLHPNSLLPGKEKSMDTESKSMDTPPRTSDAVSSGVGDALRNTAIHEVQLVFGRTRILLTKAQRLTPELPDTDDRPPEYPIVETSLSDDASSWLS
jgi:alkylated DNA nucleotide flippase Atl1